MKVMQLIDSLELGGAERMAVTFANMLSSEITRSYLCVTRAEGLLKETILPEVSYCFLERKKTIDATALKKAIRFIQKEEIDIIHAHGTSYFFAYLVKRKLNGVKLVWHNHYGASTGYSRAKHFVLKNCMRSFDVIIAVNYELKKWAINDLRFAADQTHYISNFVMFNNRKDVEAELLIGEKSQRIICLANLKHPKEHLFLSKAFLKVLRLFPKASLHFVGADYNDTYSKEVKGFISANNLKDAIFLHGKQSNTKQYLKACSIGVIASSSEGLPMALLEYGEANLAVITTDVGQCAAVVQEHGAIIPSGNVEALQQALELLLADDIKRRRLAMDYSNHIAKNYSQKAIKTEILSIYKALYG